MKFAIILAMYRRHDLEKIVIERFLEQSNKFGFDVIVAGSDGELSKEVAKGCHYIEVENYPVSVKHQALIDFVKEKDYFGVCLFGSDDLVNDGYFEWILANKDTTNVIGLQDLYFYSTTDKTLNYWSGYQNGKMMVGAGRYFSKSVLDKMNYTLWNAKRNKGLDTHCSKLLEKKGIIQESHKMEDIGVFLVDVKHSRCITSHSIIDSCKKVNNSIMAKKIGATAKKIENLEVVVKEKREFVGNEIVLFEPNGKFKALGTEIMKLVSSEAQIFESKGYGKILD